MSVVRPCRTMLLVVLGAKTHPITPRPLPAIASKTTVPFERSRPEPHRKRPAALVRRHSRFATRGAYDQVHRSRCHAGCYR
jgi:hypothetical protein